MNDELLKLAECQSYISPIKYVSGKITEYDIRSANITMLKKYNKISDEYYNYLMELPKFNREKDVGLLIRSDISYYQTISNGIIDAKKMLFIKNNINPASIVRIANDAVYINSSIDLQYRKFDIVEFRIKSISSVMVNLLNKLLIFVWYNKDGLNIDIKGIRPELQEVHGPYMISIIATVIDMAERSSISDAISYLSSFIDDYLNLRLDKEYYRELNSSSYYHLKKSDFYMTEIENVDDIDINFNLLLLRELWSILLEKYNSTLKIK